MDLGLTKRTVVVSGGGSGIGEAVTRALLAEGARVAVVGRRTQAAEKLETELTASAATAIRFYFLELTDVDACREVIRRVGDELGPIFGLVNNAGFNDSLSLESTRPEAFFAAVKSNLIHYYSLAHFALGDLKSSEGAIVNIASKVAMTGQGGTSAYAAAKGAQLALTREWAVELLKYGIRVNAVVPAEVATANYHDWLSGFADPQAKLSSIEKRIPLQHRLTRPEEIASAVLFLLSPSQSRHTTGQHLVVDGGYIHLDRAL